MLNMYFSDKEKICLLAVGFPNEEEVQKATAKLLQVCNQTDPKVVLQKPTNSANFPTGIVLYIENVETQPEGTSTPPEYWKDKVWEWLVAGPTKKERL